MSQSTELHYLDIVELAAHIKAGTISSREATLAQLERIESLDRKLCSYASLMFEQALFDAEAADQELAAGHARGPLHGIPIAVKDICWTKGHPTSAGMRLHRDFLPDRDATVVTRLRAAGAVVLGKTQLTEGAYSDYHPSIEPPRNPWNADYWPGISSSGAAIATAAGLCFAGIASDTGGSIRWPCYANGVTGIKPTWGRVSRFGVFELAASLDHVGTIARTAIDAGLLLHAIAGCDPLDPTSLTEALPDFPSVAKPDLWGMRIGVDLTWNQMDVDPATQDMLKSAMAIFHELGAELLPIEFPDARQTLRDWVANCAVEAATAHAQTFATNRSEYGAVLAAVIEHGRSLRATEYQQILLRRMDFRGRVTATFKDVDLLLVPVQPMSPLTLATIRTLGEQPELIERLQRYTCPFDMTGHPSITLPGGFTQAGMPMGFQLVAPALHEHNLVRAGAAFQCATDWHRRRPVL